MYTTTSCQMRVNYKNNRNTCYNKETLDLLSQLNYKRYSQLYIHKPWHNTQNATDHITGSMMTHIGQARSGLLICTMFVYIYLEKMEQHVESMLEESRNHDLSSDDEDTEKKIDGLDKNVASICNVQCVGQHLPKLLNDFTTVAHVVEVENMSSVANVEEVITLNTNNQHHANRNVERCTANLVYVCPIAENDTQIHSIQRSFHNINMCKEAMILDVDFSTVLIDVLKKRKNILDTEDCLLAMAASDLLCCAFYVSFIDITLSNVQYRVVRYFEFGSVKGFFNNVLLKKINSSCCAPILPYAVYTKVDVEAKKHYDISLFTSRRKISQRNPQEMAYIRHTKINKTNLSKSFSGIVSSVNGESIQCVKAAVFVMHKNQQFEGSNDSKKIFMSSPTIWEELEVQLLNFRMASSTKNNYPAFNSSFSSTLSLQQQFQLISSIPNYHKWSWYLEKNNDVRLEQKFSNSCRRFPGSPRNRIIQAVKYRLDSQLIVYSIIKTLHSEFSEIPYKAIKSHHSQVKKERTSKRKHNHVAVNQNDDEDGDVNSDENMAEEIINNDSTPVFRSTLKESLYRFFCGEIFTKGVCKWRIKTAAQQTVIMNDYDSETGNFLAYSFVHVSISMLGTTQTDHCTCKIFSTCQTENVPTCCHCRLLNELLQFNTSNVLPPHISKESIEESMYYCVEPVIPLKPKVGVKKFSIAANGVAEIVSIFTVENTSRKVVQCHSSVCNMRKGSKREIKSLEDSSELCVHLATFRKFYLNNREIFSEDDLGEHIYLPDKKWENVFDVWIMGFWKEIAKYTSSR
ncbi:uncharacterized protein LOC130622573 isoform X2 [Hydractinia symbiolongicarpus]|uniref:uncharacterized protein LOC130622573 isoform X2 n=1 Tax=Hydractinia symbiolongicarpus TaxID=13093 RepID=UPI00254C6E7A|nr:uncharacterized protein LOC130622573 isoform X2 [Hydractinia symbiolongicarpus]